MIKKIKDWSIQLSPSKRRAISVVFIMIVAVGSAYILLHFILPYIIIHTEFTKMTPAEAIASVAVVATITIATTNFVVASLKRRYESKKQLSLSVDVQGNKVIITSTVQNTGSGRITPKCFYLFINEGKSTKRDSYVEYEFPNILKHECGEFDCALAKKCKASRIKRLPDEILGDKFKGNPGICSVLNHIASDSVNFIDPGEIFSEDAIFELTPGVYRVILVGITVEADCMCAHKIFSVNNDSKS